MKHASNTTTTHRKTSLADVAQYAGVSTATVSRVLNSDSRESAVSSDTRHKVLKAVETLQYRPNLLARKFSRQRTDTVGLVASNMLDPHVSELAAGVERAVREANYQYLLSNASNKVEWERRCINMLAQRQVDGLIITGFAGETNKDSLQAYANSDAPVVEIGRRAVSEHIASVTLDNVKGARLAVEHLIKFGHQHIVYIPGEYHDSAFRYTGYRQSMEAAGLKPAPQILTQGGVSTADAYWGMKRFLAMKQGFTAVFCYNDLMAIGVMKALQESGWSIPRDCSVVGFDDVEISQYLHPALTTVIQPGLQMGYQAATMLLQMLQDPSGMKQREVVFEPSLVVRESTAPCPGRPIR